MCCENHKENEKNCCLAELLNEILMLQNRDMKETSCGGCDKPFLGPNINCTCYNTRPLSFYNCQTGDLWNIQYTVNGATNTSTVFRIEKLDDCCCTCRILIQNTDRSYTPTTQFFTIDLNCVSAVQCHPDVFIDIC